ncbi:ATP-dependent RecD-like DNA helicase [Methylopila henanensis]|uniref:ATP-dependent RecD-like DNA helicase n=1 Tax=Methylopila henanensis TaxID=873516 RepID=A0ABW4K0Y4_9HYPH
MRWSPQQDEALAAVADWLRRPRDQVFRLFGYAGTGKTTLARHLAEDMDGDVAFGAYTGKAALVMRSKGCVGASTIHAMIYRPRGGDEEGPSFSLNRDGSAAKADLIVIDECSMVDEELGRDLLSFGKKVLVLGDPAQLPPVKGGGFFTEAEPNAMLTEVHRQAVDDPIIRMSLAVREGQDLDAGVYGESRVISRRDIRTEDVTGADQVLVGMNRTRRLYNNRLRELKGLHDPMPAVGDKLVCLRNDKTKGLFNGGTWTVQRLKGTDATRVKMDVTPEDESSRRSVSVSVLRGFFEGEAEAIPFAQRRRSDEFDYGYALTVHKAQGSQWDDVVLFDESYAFREHRARWLYTGLTRAAKRVTVVR